MKKNKYNKILIEQEALKSLEQGEITNNLGKFILRRAEEIVNYSFITNGDKELRQTLIDNAVMRVCEKFLMYYKPDGSAANLIITMIYSTMRNRIKSLKWKDVYGTNIKGNITVIENGERVTKLTRYTKDDNISKRL